MNREYTNNEVFEFLTEICRCNSKLWEKFSTGLLSQTKDDDFWALLSEYLDCFRICDECGKPMLEGYVVNGYDVYCSEGCLHKHLTDKEFNYLYDNGNGDTYWTTWYEDSMTLRENKI